MSKVQPPRVASTIRGRIEAFTAVSSLLLLMPGCAGESDTPDGTTQSASSGTTSPTSVTPSTPGAPVAPTGTAGAPVVTPPPSAGQPPSVPPTAGQPPAAPPPVVNPPTPVPDTPPTAASSGEDSVTSEQPDSAGETTSPPGPGASDTELEGIETPGANCQIPDLGDFGSLQAIEKLPDPFVMMDGTPVTTRAQWVCRRAEISAMLQKWEAGIKPPKPASVTGAKSGNGIEVTVSDGAGKTLTFSASISYPTGGTGPYPAMIGLAGGSLPQNTIKDLGVATINFGNDAMGNQSGKRGTGQFFDFNGKVDAGALLAWAWGVSRLIDALEVTPDVNIDTKHLGVTGCSRNGKGALMIGALDARIALTIPQESGSGGVAAWRVSEVDDGGRDKVQTMRSAHTEQPWFAEALGQFTSNVDKLPIDHHQLIAMVAPRGLLGLGNPQYEWLGINSSDQAMHAGRTVYEALGAKPNIGYQESSHTHCSYAQSEVPALEAFVRKFLLGEDVSTDFWKTQEQFAADQWAGWQTPSLQ